MFVLDLLDLLFKLVMFGVVYLLVITLISCARVAGSGLLGIVWGLRGWVRLGLLGLNLRLLC